MNERDRKTISSLVSRYRKRSAPHGVFEIGVCQPSRTEMCHRKEPANRGSGSSSYREVIARPMKPKKDNGGGEKQHDTPRD